MLLYNGWNGNYYVGNAFVFAPSGVIISCAYNAPGVFYDSKIAQFGKVYYKLKKCHEETGGRCFVD